MAGILGRTSPLAFLGGPDAEKHSEDLKKKKKSRVKRRMAKLSRRANRRVKKHPLRRLRQRTAVTSELVAARKQAFSPDKKCAIENRKDRKRRGRIEARAKRVEQANILRSFFGSIKQVPWIVKIRKGLVAQAEEAELAGAET